jgi:hypothetical protein
MLIYKLVAGLAAFVLGASVVVAFPGFTSMVQASLTSVKKSERLDSGATSCLQAPWPHGCQWRAGTETTCQQEPWPYGCQWRASPESSAKRFAARSGSTLQERRFQFRRVHGVLTKVRIARREATKAR